MDTQAKTIFVACGPAGCGKSTLAKHLAVKLSVPFIEGDDYHSTTNKSKMASGIPLNDSDRWNWLITLRDAALDQLATANTVVVTCSSLRQRYRDVFRVASYTNPDVRVRFIYLSVDLEHLQARTRSRTGHYMKDNMVLGQIESLEEPDNDETDVITLDGRQDPIAVFHDALQFAYKELAGDSIMLKKINERLQK